MSQISRASIMDKGAVTLGNFSCNLSRNFVATQVARCYTGCLNRVTLGNVSCNLSRSRRSHTARRTGIINNINWRKNKKTMNWGGRKRKCFALLVTADFSTANEVFNSDGRSFNAWINPFFFPHLSFWKLSWVQPPFCLGIKPRVHKKSNLIGQCH